jgi:RHS repeat-associated protein
VSKIIKFALVVNFILILFILNARAADQVYFYHTDPVGTPMAISDANGQVVWRGDYKPFGEEDSVTGSLANDRKFIGKEKDEETGPYYFGARYMESKIGRFTAVDPVRAVDPRTSETNDETNNKKDEANVLIDPQKLNSYVYAHNNPMRWIDPFGLRDVDVFIWRAKGSSVGHVMVTEANSNHVILSQFPSKVSILGRGPNLRKNFGDTVRAEARLPSEIWRVHVPNDKAFDQAAAHERGLSSWEWNPSKSSTQCTIAASRALKAGGVGITTITTGTLMPGFFANNL